MPRINACIYCAGETESHQWGGSSCRSCGSVMVTDPPTSAELANFYDNFLNDYHGGGEENGSARRQACWGKAYLRAITRFASCGSLLDIGPANNPFPNLAKESGFEVHVMDFKRPPALRPDIPFIEASLNHDQAELKQHARSYDIVTSWAVLEHCLDTQKAVELMAGFCKTGGYIILTTPEVGTIADTHGAGRTPWFYPPEHIFLISRKALCRLFETRGCKLVQMRKFEYNIPRWTARYAIVAAEGVVGLAIKAIAPRWWKALRNERQTRAAGITLCVFQKEG